jgi:hypothetical protein
MGIAVLHLLKVRRRGAILVRRQHGAFTARPCQDDPSIETTIKEMQVRIVLSAAVAVGALAAIGLPSTLAQARDYPFCIRGYDYAGPMGDCSFDSYAQCLAAASGRHDYCDRNYFFNDAGNVRPVNPGKRRRY